MDKSIFTEVVQEMMEEVAGARESAAKSKSLPLMTEEVRRRDALKRLGAMSEGERKEYRQKYPDEVLRIIKGGRRG